MRSTLPLEVSVNLRLLVTYYKCWDYLLVFIKYLRGKRRQGHFFILKIKFLAYLIVDILG